MKYEFLENNIVYFEGVISNYQEIISMIEKTSNNAVTEWNPWYAYNSNNKYGDIKYMARKELKEIQDVEEKDRSKFIIDSLTDAMISCATKYSELFNIDKDNLNFAIEVLKNDETKIGLYKYSEGAHMGPHVDWNDDQYYLAYTIVVYLNDDYEGGELHFDKLGIKLKPKGGSIAMYPSVEPYSHESLPIIKGRKMLITHHWRSSDFK